MKINKEPVPIWQEYEKGRNYNVAVNLYESVKQNEDFYVGNQWEGVSAPDLQKPTLNFLNRTVSYFIAMLVTDDIAASIKPFRETEETILLSEAVNKDVTRIIEQERVKAKNRSALRNAAVDGDACFYLWFDPDRDSGQDVTGDVRVENIRNINCIFGNPYVAETQEQPYIIIVMRRITEEVRDEAERNGMPTNEIISDDDNRQGEENSESALCTVLIKLWRENGTIWAVKTTEKAVVREPWNTNLKLYPVAWMNWAEKQSSYHGQAALTGLIQNQISVNRLMAMTIRSVELNAFPKIIFDNTKFVDGWTNRIGEAIGIAGNTKDAFADVFRGADVSAQVADVIQRIVDMTRDFMGATDAALGNIQNPDNTSALIAVQQASAVPLELQRLAFFDFVEQYVRIMVDLMRANYGTRLVNVEVDSAKLEQVQPDAAGGVNPFDAIQQPGMPGQEPQKTIKREVEIDYGKANPHLLNVDIGTAAYWSELTQMQTMDNLVKSGIISDVVLYLESIPDKYLPNKTKIIDSAKAQQEQLQQTAQLQQGTTPPNQAGVDQYT